jgi:hypothetical protein
MGEITCFLERLAERQPEFVLFGGRVYSPSESNLTQGNVQEDQKDRLELGSLTLNLIPSMPFSFFESLDRSSQRAEIEALGQRYVREKVDREISGETDQGGEVSKIKTLTFIMYDFLPFFVSRKYGHEDGLMVALGLEEETAITDPVERARSEMSEYLNHRFGAEAPTALKDKSALVKKRVIAREREGLAQGAIVEKELSLKEMGLTQEEISPSQLGEILGNQPVYVMNERLYGLRKVRSTEDFPGEIVVHLNGHKYVVGNEMFGLDQAIQVLRGRQIQRNQLEILERSSSEWDAVASAISSSGIKEQHMRELSKLGEFDYEGSGFILKDGRYYVYATIPKFATQDGRDPSKFWPYEATRVAIKVGWDRGGIRSWDRPVVVERREFHPCLSGRSNRGGFCEICNLSREPSSYSNTLLDLVRKIGDAANTITTPLSKESLDRHSGEAYFGTTLKDILQQGSLTREEAIKKGYQVIEVIETKVGEA